MPPSDLASHALPEHMQRNMMESKMIINEFGAHKITQLEDALHLLKVNEAPSMDKLGPFNYFHSTVNLHSRNGIKILKEHIKSSMKHVKALKNIGHPGREDASQLHSDLKTVSAWTKKGKDPHEIFEDPKSMIQSQSSRDKNRPIHYDPHSVFHPTVPSSEYEIKKLEAHRRYRATRPTNRLLRTQMKPEIREAEIERLEKEHQVASAILDRHKLPASSSHSSYSDTE